MANKNIHKIRLNVNNLLDILHKKNLTISGLGRDSSFGWNEKTVRRAIKDGEASVGLFNDLVSYLKVPVARLTCLENDIYRHQSGITGIINNMYQHADKYEWYIMVDTFDGRQFSAPSDQWENMGRFYKDQMFDYRQNITKTDDKNYYVELKFVGSEEDVERAMAEVKKIVKEIAPEAVLVTETTPIDKEEV